MDAKLTKCLVSFEKRHNEWEWSDLMKWLHSLTKIFVKYKTSCPSDSLLNLLSKRLSQCLNPSLPPGVHSKTLELYEQLLSVCDIAHFHWFSAGLFPFFQHCSSQNKIQFLTLIQNIYIPKSQQIANILPGLLASLLSGADERPDMFNRVKDILMSLSESSKELVQEGVWSIIKKCPQFRMPGLKYMVLHMDISMHRHLAVYSLINCFEDKSVQVKRQALDLMKIHFGLNSNYETELKIQLMEGALKLLQYKDLTLMRRLWDWVFPEDDENEYMISEIMTPALKGIFQEYSDDEHKLTLIKIIDVLFENDQIGLMLVEKIGILYLRHVILAELYIINGKEDQRALLTFNEEKGCLLWRSFNRYLDENVYTSTQECIQMLDFAVKNISYRPDEIIETVDIMLLALSNHFIDTKIFEICVILSKNLKSLPERGASHSVRLFTSLESDSQDSMLTLSVLLKQFSSLGLDIGKAINHARTMRLETPESRVRRIQILINLGSTELWKEDMHFLWAQNNLQLLLQSQKLVPEIWTQSLSELLLQKGKEKTLKSFINFWDKFIIDSPEQLFECLKDGKCVFIVIDMLTDDSPIVRHIARKWLFSTQKAIWCLLDPILSVLLHKHTRRNDQSEYVQAYDSRRILEGIRKLRVIVEMGPSLKQVMDECIVSTACQEFVNMHGLIIGTYLEIVLDVALLFLNSRSSVQTNENAVIQLSVCEFLQEYVKGLPCALAFKALHGCNMCLQNAVNTNSGVMQTLIMRTIHSILVSCEIQSLPFRCVQIFSSSEFSFAITRGLHTKDAFLRMNWISFIENILPFLLEFLEHPLVTQYVSGLICSYVSILEETGDLKLLIGLKNIVHLSLNIKPCKKIDPNIKSMIFSPDKLRMIFDLAIQLFIKFDPSKRRKMEIFDIEEELNAFFSPVATTYTKEFLDGVLDYWDSEKYDNFMKIFPCINLDIITILDGIISYLTRNSRHLVMGHFLFTLLNSLIRLQVSTPDFWGRIIRILRQIADSSLDESSLLVISLLFVISKHSLEIDDKKTKKDLQEILENSVDKACSAVFKNTKDANVFFPTIKRVKQEPMKLQTLIIHVFTDEIVPTINFYMSDKSSKVLKHLCKLFLGGFLKNKIESELVSELILVLVSSVTLGKSLKKEFIEYFTSSQILSNGPCLPTWLKIIDVIASQYSEKNTLFVEVLSKLHTSVFTSHSNTVLQTKNFFLVSSLILLSGKPDDYVQSAKSLAEKIKSCIDNQDYFPYICILIRSLIVRMNKEKFLEVWINVWAELQILLVKFVKYSHASMAGLKLLDMLIALSFEELYSVLWIFFFDTAEIEIEEGDNQYYMPLLAKEFLQGFCARPVKLERAQTEMKKRVKKEPMLAELEDNRPEDVERAAKNLVQFCLYYNSTLASTNFQKVDDSIQIDLTKL